MNIFDDCWKYRQSNFYRLEFEGFAVFFVYLFLCQVKSILYFLKRKSRCIPAVRKVA